MNEQIKYSPEREQPKITLETLRNPEKAETIIAKVKEEVFDVYDKAEATAKDVNSAEIAYGKIHLDDVAKLTQEYGNYIGATKEEIALAKIAAYLHDAQKYNPQRSAHERLQLHAHDSWDWAETLLDKWNFDEKTKNILENAIKKHQGMPFVNAVLTKAKAEKDWAIERKEVNGTKLEHVEKKDIELAKRGYHLPPNDRVSALLFCADLMSLGNPAGGFNKIVAIEFNRTKSIPEALNSAYTSLVANVNRLKYAKKYIKPQMAELKKDAKIKHRRGRRYASEIESDIGNHFGPIALKKISTALANLQKEMEQNPKKFKGNILTTLDFLTEQ